jgi:hypothetical protein
VPSAVITKQEAERGDRRGVLMNDEKDPETTTAVAIDLRKDPPVITVGGSMSPRITQMIVVVRIGRGRAAIGIESIETERDKEGIDMATLTHLSDFERFEPYKSTELLLVNRIFFYNVRVYCEGKQRRKDEESGEIHTHNEPQE